MEIILNTKVHKDNIIDAARTLVEKLELIHKNENYQAVWQIAAIHHCQYTGPSYEKELAELKRLLES